jgi:hypothetical protein
MKNRLILLTALLLVNFAVTGSPNSFTADFGQIRSNLYIVSADKSTVLMDGTLTQYDMDYSNDIDGMDARKMSNFSENLGLLRANTVLVIERRQTIRGNDSIFFKMWNLRTFNYQLEFIASNLNKYGATGVLEDNYLHTSSTLNLNGTTHLNFSVTNDPASKASDRFRIIFTTAIYSPLPVTFIAAKAFLENKLITIDWKTANESHVNRYNIERSVDGINFLRATEIKANNQSSNSYRWTDTNLAGNNNYYRIRSIDNDGKISYSDIMKVYVAKSNQSISIYPNPATGNHLNVQLVNQEPGLYEMRLLNSFGQNFMTKSFQYSGGTNTQNIKPAQSIPKGIYQLEIKTPCGNKKVISVVF